MHAMHMRLISSVACPALQYVSQYLMNGTNFENKVIERKIWVMIFSTTFS
jgi:hypothetical protein